MKQPKRHIYLDDFEWRVAINGLNKFRSQLIREGSGSDDMDRCNE